MHATCMGHLQNQNFWQDLISCVQNNSSTGVHVQNFGIFVHGFKKTLCMGNDEKLNTITVITLPCMIDVHSILMTVVRLSLPLVHMC